MSLKVEFIGHACYRIWQDGRPLVVTDPYTHSDVGLEDDGRRLESEYVIVSSLIDLSHNNYSMVAGQPKVINALDVAVGKAAATINDEPVIAIPVAEHPEHPTGPDDNGMYAFKAGGLWFAHVGDLGFGMTEPELAPWVGRCDVLMAITGGIYSLTLQELDGLIDYLRPKIVLPMHYHLPPPGGPMLPLADFLNQRPDDPVIITNSTTIELPLPEIKPGHPTIVVLKPAGYTPSKAQLNYS